MTPLDEVTSAVVTFASLTLTSVEVTEKITGSSLAVKASIPSVKSPE